MQFDIPAKVRFAIYIIGGIGSILVIYLQSKNIIGESEVNLWAALQVFINGLAAVKTGNAINESAKNG